MRKLATSINSKCIDCKIKRKQRAGQSMGDLPSFRTEMAPGWYGMDLLVPQEGKDDVIKRGPKRTMKVLIVVLTCVSTRASHIDIATDHSTEGFLHSARRLMAIQGYHFRPRNSTSWGLKRAY